MSGLKGLSNSRLLAQLNELVQRGHELEADLIEHLAEVDAWRLYLREGCASMFAYSNEDDDGAASAYWLFAGGWVRAMIAR